MPKIAAPVGADPQDTVSFSSLISQLEEGAFDRDLSAVLRNLVARLTNQYRRDGGRPKGTISLALEFTLIDGLMHTSQSFSFKPDVRPSDRFYPTTDGRLTQDTPAVQNDLALPAKKGARG